MCQSATENRQCENISWVGYALIAVFMVAVLYLPVLLGMEIWNGYKYKQIVSIEDFGSITNASYSAFLSNTKTAIQTEKGTLLVDGALQGINGHHVQIEYRGNGDKALCVVERSACKRILGD